jgi:hypothetical protein
MCERKIMYTSDTVYRSFIKALETIIKDTDISKFEEVWKSVSSKTEFYKKNFFESLADNMSCKLKTEEFRCDFTLMDSDDFPLVRIESENKHGTASHEIYTLCRLLSPLKVLFLSCEWTDSEGKKFLPEWREAIRKFNLSYPTDFKFCIVIGEWGRRNPPDDILRYCIATLSSDGEIFDEFEIQKTTPQH